MLSEFEVPKPENGFNQIILEPEEVFIDSIRVTLLLANDWNIQGYLRVCSRSLVFQPKTDSCPLFKFKFADQIQMTSGKLTVTYVEKELGEGYDEFIHNLKRVVKRPAPQGPTSSYKSGNNQKQICVLIKVKRFVVYPTQPVAPYATEIFRCYFLFRIDGSFKYQPPSTNPQLDDLVVNCGHFERLCNKIKKCEVEDDLIEDIFQERLSSYRHKVSNSSRINFMYPCKIVETFEKFMGCLVMKDDRRLKIKALLNVTKEVDRSFECREVKWMTVYPFYYRKTGIEFFIYGSAQSILLDFGSEKTVEKIYAHLSGKCTEVIDIQLNALTKTWNSNLMSNYDYLMYLNRLSNRSFNDVARYPLFPWVISDYSGDDFQINQRAQYRDLSKPMHCHWRSREARAMEVYETLAKDPVPTRRAFHCPQFSSTPGAVVYFYTRSVPLLITRLQSDAFGQSDRIFRGFETLWSQMQNGQTQFVELIPEMFTVNKADVLRNKYGLDFGSSPDGEETSDVALPKWAISAQDFMFKMKAALESEFCSLHLHSWIDLVFGVCARGDQAVKNGNIFAEECYKETFEGMVVRSKLKEQANRMLIHQYGQMPVQLFNFAHPKKKIKAQLLPTNNLRGEREPGFNGFLVKLTADVGGENQEGTNRDADDSSLAQVHNLANSSDLFDKMNTLHKDLKESLLGSQMGDRHSDKDGLSGVDWRQDIESNEED